LLNFLKLQVLNYKVKFVLMDIQTEKIELVKRLLDTNDELILQ